MSQNNWKIQADLKKDNNVKESKVYLITNDNDKKLIGWYLYDKQGRELEQKSISTNGEINSHYKFEYPNDSIRFFSSIDKNGNEISKKSQKFSLTAESLESKTSDKISPIIKEYNSQGNMTKVWKRLDDGKILLSKFSYDKNNLRTREILYLEKEGKSVLNTKRIIYRDQNGLLEKIVAKQKGKVDFVTVYEYEKYST